jgi:hypothetical protein
MASARQLPELISEFFDLARQYLKDAILEPARRLGRQAGLGFAASFVLTLAALFLGVALMRTLVRVMPDGLVWTGLGYLAASIALLATTGFVMWRATR